MVLPIFVRQSGPMPPSVILSDPSAAPPIESYLPEVLFGLLQTPDYARAVEQADAFAPDADLVARRVAHRLRTAGVGEADILQVHRGRPPGQQFPGPPAAAAGTCEDSVLIGPVWPSPGGDARL